MIRLHCIVEGQTEEEFVNRILSPHLAAVDVFADVRMVYTSRDGPYYVRGGVTSYQRVKRDVAFWLRQDQNSDARFTTMLDFYRLPEDFPGWNESVKVPSPHGRVAILEQELGKDIGDPRFIPYIQVHEFEALVLTDPSRLALMYPSPERRKAIEVLVELGRQYCERDSSPELINLNAPPSKRILDQIPEYDKVVAGVLVVEDIGLERTRRACLHFGEWLSGLENLAGVSQRL